MLCKNLAQSMQPHSLIRVFARVFLDSHPFFRWMANTGQTLWMCMLIWLSPSKVRFLKLQPYYHYCFLSFFFFFFFFFAHYFLFTLYCKNVFCAILVLLLSPVWSLFMDKRQNKTWEGSVTINPLSSNQDCNRWYFILIFFFINFRENKAWHFMYFIC